MREVASGGVGIRLKDETGFIPSDSDRLIHITDTPSVIVTEVLHFDSEKPGPSKKVTRPCPLCKELIVINQMAPPPSEYTPASPADGRAVGHRRELDRSMMIALMNHLRLKSSKHGKGTTSGLYSTGTNALADAHALFYSLLTVSRPAHGSISDYVLQQSRFSSLALRSHFNAVAKTEGNQSAAINTTAPAPTASAAPVRCMLTGLLPIYLLTAICVF